MTIFNNIINKINFEYHEDVFDMILKGSEEEDFMQF